MTFFSFQVHLLPDLYEEFVLELVAGLGRALEVEIMSSEFNQVGVVFVLFDRVAMVTYVV